MKKKYQPFLVRHAQVQKYKYNSSFRLSFLIIACPSQCKSISKTVCLDQFLGPKKRNLKKKILTYTEQNKTNVLYINSRVTFDNLKNSFKNSYLPFPRTLNPLTRSEGAKYSLG